MQFIRNAFISKDKYKLKVKGLNKLFHANGMQKKSGVIILIENQL